MTEVILGINSAYHEPAACLLVDGRLVAMAEEERFNRFRHGKLSLIDNSDDLPLASCEFCLAQAGVGWGDVTAIGYSLEPAARLAANQDRPAFERTPGGWGTEEGERVFYEHNLNARTLLTELAPNAEFYFLAHHRCHAASAYLVSPFDAAAVLVVDGIGEGDSSWLGVGEGDALRELETAPYPHSIGFVWEKLSEYLGFDAYTGPGKVMGYACITDPEGELTGHHHDDAMREIFRPDPDGLFFVDEQAFRFNTGDFRGLERYFGPRRTQYVDRYEDASIGAALQLATNDVLVHLANRLYQRINADRAEHDKVRDLCLAGGVALNCVANYELAARTPFERIWVQPAANDAGTALGAAVLLHLERGGRGRPRMEHAYLGPGFDADRCRAALDAAGLAYTSPDGIIDDVARRIERGEIVAWFDGRQEVGPRALGHRSIVCDPTRFDTRNRINAQVKRRESFRPFAPSILPAAIDRFFETPAEMLSIRYMLHTLPLKEPKLQQVIPAVIQTNGSTGVATSRVHLVEAAHAPRYAALLEAFMGLTGIPLVLNTSFNIREPIITTPEQAVATFLRSSMNALALGPYLVPHPKAGA